MLCRRVERAHFEARGGGGGDKGSPGWRKGAARVRVGVRVKGGVGVGVRVTRAGARAGVRVGEIWARRTSSWGCAGRRQR